MNPATFTDPYQNKLLREAATQFIDPAAYYGLHVNGGSIYKFGQTAAIKTPASIYNLIAAFATKNNIYIYVQSERQRSYNFYGNYKISDTNLNNIKIGTTEANLVEDKFETIGWPVKVFNTAPANGSTQQTIALQFTTDRKSNTSMYGAMANLISANTEGFVDGKNLIAGPDQNEVVSYFTKTILLSSQISNNLNVASFIQLLYLGKEILLTEPGIDDGNPNTPIPDVQVPKKYMDEVFYLTNATSFLESEKVFHIHSYKPTFYNQQDIDKKRERVISFTQRTEDIITINETESLTLFTYLSIVKSEQSAHSNFTPDTSANKEATGYAVQNVTDSHTLPGLPGNEYVELYNFSDSGQAVKGIAIKTYDGSLPSSMILGLTDLENSTIKNLLIDKNNPKIYFKNLLSAQKDVFVSPEKIEYKVYVLGIIVETQQGDLETLYGTTEIKVYSLDGLVFTSSGYAEYITNLSYGLSYTILKL